MKKKKRSFSGYEEKQSVRIGNEEMILAEKIYVKKPYMVCDYKIWEYANLFTKSMVTNVMMSADYLEVIKEFARRVQISTEILRAERDKRGIPPQLLMARDCVPCGLEKPLLGKIIVCKQEMLHPEFRTIEHQVGLVTIDQGKAIFAKKILTGEDLLWKRSALAGVIRPDQLPPWAMEKLEMLLNPEKESIREQLKSTAKAPPDHTEKQKNAPKR